MSMLKEVYNHPWKYGYDEGSCKALVNGWCRKLPTMNTLTEMLYHKYPHDLIGEREDTFIRDWLKRISSHRKAKDSFPKFQRDVGSMFPHLDAYLCYDEDAASVIVTFPVTNGVDIHIAKLVIHRKFKQHILSTSVTDSAKALTFSRHAMIRFVQRARPSHPMMLMKEMSTADTINSTAMNIIGIKHPQADLVRLSDRFICCPTASGSWFGICYNDGFTAHGVIKTFVDSEKLREDQLQTSSGEHVKFRVAGNYIAHRHTIWHNYPDTKPINPLPLTAYQAALLYTWNNDIKLGYHYMEHCLNVPNFEKYI